MIDKTKKYPNIEDFDYNQTIDEKTITLIREVLIDSAMNVINNTI